MVDVVDDRWPDADPDAEDYDGAAYDGDDDLDDGAGEQLPAVPVHELEVYEPARASNDRGTSTAGFTRMQRAVYYTTIHGRRSPKYLWRCIVAFFRGLGATIVGTYHLVVPASLVVAKQAAEAGGNPKAIEHAHDRLKWAIILRLLAVAAGIAIPLQLTAGQFYYDGQLIGLNLGLELTLWIFGAVTVIALIVVGAMNMPQPIVDMPAPRPRSDATVETVNAAFQALKIIAAPRIRQGYVEVQYPDGGVNLAGMPATDRRGTELLIELPRGCGKSVYDVMKLNQPLSAAFGVPLEALAISPGNHPGQVRLWVAHGDPWAGGHPAHPLLYADEASVWDGAPAWVDVRGRLIVAPLVYSSYLFGARPRRGKSFAVRSLLATPILDPRATLIIANAKPDGTYEAAKPLCRTYIRGCDGPDVADLVDALEWVKDEMNARNRRLPGSKLTKRLAAKLDMHPIFVVLDEVQEYFEDRMYGGKDGGRIGALLISIAKVGPSVGIILVFSTQRPSSEAFPSELRAVIGARYCLQVMSYIDSNIILGSNMSKIGYDASQLMRRGIAYYRADDDGDGAPDELAQLVRAYDMDEPSWIEICGRGAELRGVEPFAEVVDAELVDESYGDDSDGYYSDDTTEVVPAVVEELLTPTELFERIGRFEPQIFRDHGVKTVEDLGRLLSRVGIPSQAFNKQRVRARSVVEAAFDLSPGRLASVDRTVDSTDRGAPVDGPETVVDGDGRDGHNGQHDEWED